MTRILITLVTLSCFTACTTLQPLPDTSSLQPGDTVVIERNDGTQLTMKLEAVSAEMLQGVYDGKRHSVPVSDIRSVGARTMTTSDKVWTAAGVVAGIVGVIALASGGLDGLGGEGGGGGY